MKKTKPRKVSAWLVTRHWVADNPRWEVAAIFSPRLGGVRVREFVDLLHVTSTLMLHEQASIMWPRYGGSRAPARFGQTKEGDPWAGEVYTWGDPYLMARIVDDLKVDMDVDGRETTTWKERPRASSGWMHTKQALPSEGGSVHAAE
jgi:hypothetical protein